MLTSETEALALQSFEDAASEQSMANYFNHESAKLASQNPMGLILR